MKAIIKLFIGLFVVVLFSSCITYQHVSLSGNVAQNEQAEFVVENDSIKMVYSFNGHSGPITMEITNKLNKPLYVDWRKSALIINGQSFTLWKDEASLSANISSNSALQGDQTIQTSGNVQGSIIKNDKVSFIPPLAKIVVHSYTLYDGLFITPDQQGEKLVFFTALDEKRKAIKYSFSRENSPFTFRIFLSMSANDDFKSPFHLDNTFWVSNYVNTRVELDAFNVYLGNQFYNVK